MSGCASRGWRRFRRTAIGLAALMVGAFVLLQIAIRTPWVKKFASTRIENRTGFPTRIEGLSWTPWSGGEVRGLVLEQPQGIELDQPLLRIERLRAQPRYLAILRGKRSFKTIDLKGAEVNLTVEMLASMAMSAAPPEFVPEVAMVETAGPDSAVAERSTPETTPEPVVIARPVDRRPAAAPGEHKPPVPTPVQAAGRPVEVGVEGFSCTLWSSTRNARIGSVRDVEFRGVLPGDAGAHTGRIRSIEAGEATIQSEVGFDVEVLPGSLRIKLLNDSSKNKQLVGSLVIGRNGLRPFRTMFQADVGEPVRWTDGESSRCSIKRLTGAGEMAGYLAHPQSWQGRGVVQAEGPEVKIGDSEVAFDRASVAILVQGGVWHIPDFRAIGSELSVLGNGRVAGPRSRGVARLVMNEAVASHVLSATGFPRSGLQALDPGNRTFLDLDVGLSPAGWMVAVPGMEVPEPLKQLMETIDWR